MKKTEEETMLKVEHLSKAFDDYKAVDDISFTVSRGQILGFLGPNGAGKTTTIKMLAGILQPDRGSIRINNIDLAAFPEECKKITGYIPDRPYLYEKLTGAEFLQFVAGLYGLERREYERCHRYLELFDLGGWNEHLIESYSHGMRQKLIMTATFMLEPPLIIVDEPMVGLDPKSARLVKELFREYAGSGKTIFLSTHSLEIAEQICDRIAIIQQGRIRAMGSLEALRREARLEESGLEDVFLELTGAHELGAVIQALTS